MRVDKWLWAARFFKTRSLAQRAISASQVRLNDEKVKASHDLKIGDSLAVRIGDFQWVVEVKGLSEKRGPAVQAKLLYEETAASRAERERRLDMRRWGGEPADSIKGRPTKKDRRDLEDWTGQTDDS
jgi:ribosome-associated heat shock protein Hsp15